MPLVNDRTRLAYKLSIELTAEEAALFTYMLASGAALVDERAGVAPSSGPGFKLGAKVMKALEDL